MSNAKVRLAVSVQAPGFEDKPWDGHLAAGVLVASDQLFVPVPPEDLPPELVVLVVPIPLDAGLSVQRIGVLGVRQAPELFGANDRALVLDLASAVDGIGAPPEMVTAQSLRELFESAVESNCSHSRGCRHDGHKLGYCEHQCGV